MECALIQFKEIGGAFSRKICSTSPSLSKTSKKFLKLSHMAGQKLFKISSNHEEKGQQVFSLQLQTSFFASCLSLLNESLRILGKYIFFKVLKFKRFNNGRKELTANYLPHLLLILQKPLQMRTCEDILISKSSLTLVCHHLQRWMTW